MERLWLAMAVATLWVLEVGGEAEVEEQQQRQRARAAKVAGVDTPELPNLDPQAEVAEAASGAAAAGTAAGDGGIAKRIFSVFARGWQLLKDALAAGLVLLGSWHPEPWPGRPLAGLPGTPHTGNANAELAGIGSLGGANSMPGVHADDSG